MQQGGTFTASSLHSSGQSDTLTIRGDWAPGQHDLGVTFLNDAWDGGSGDRNLYVDAASYDGAALSGPPVTLYSAGEARFAFDEPWA